MNTDRLNHLITILEALPAWKLDMRDWISCGTAACAVGWAAQDPVFNEQGLYLMKGWPALGGLESWDAVRAFFDLDQDEAEHLFSADQYPNPDDDGEDDDWYNPTPAEVAARIKTFMENSNEQ